MKASKTFTNSGTVSRIQVDGVKKPPIVVEKVVERIIERPVEKIVERIVERPAPVRAPPP